MKRIKVRPPKASEHERAIDRMIEVARQFAEDPEAAMKDDNPYCDLAVITGAARAFLKKTGPEEPMLECIDPEKGFISGNVRPVCSHCLLIEAILIGLGKSPRDENRQKLWTTVSSPCRRMTPTRN